MVHRRYAEPSFVPGSPLWAVLRRARRDGFVELSGDVVTQVIALRRLREEGADVAIRVPGLTSEALADASDVVCDAVVSMQVPLEFSHDGRTLRLQVMPSHRPPTGRSTGRPSSP